MNKSLRLFIFASLATSMLTGCGNGNKGATPGQGNTTISVTSNTPGVVTSAGSTKSFDWVITATSNTDFTGYKLNFSSVNGTLSLTNNGCTGQVLAGNSCNITFSYKAPASASTAIYQRPVFSYVNGNNSVTKTGYVDVFPMFYTIPQNASEGQTGPASNIVYSMAMNNQGCLYIATYNGLSISCDQGKTYSQRTIANGLPSNSLTSVAVDGQTVYVAATNWGFNSQGALPLNSVAISNDGGNTFTPVTIPWSIAPGTISMSLDSNHILHVVNTQTADLATLTSSGNVTLSPAIFPWGSTGIGSSANGTTYVSNYDTNNNTPAIYASQDNYQTPVAENYPNDNGVTQIYNPKGTNDLYLMGFNQLIKVPNTNFSNMIALDPTDVNSTNNAIVTSAAVSGQFIYAGLSFYQTGSPQGLLYSKDGGTTFTNITDPNSGLATPNVEAIYIPSSDFLLNNTTDNNVYIATQNAFNDNTGGLSIGTIGADTNGNTPPFTNYSGTNPTPIFSAPNNATYNSITALYSYVNGNQDAVFAGTNTGFEYSLDGGKTFNYVDISNYTSGTGKVNAFIVSGNNLLVATTDNQSGGALLRYSLNLQKVTFITALQSGIPIYDLSQSGGTIFAATGNGLLYSNDGGNNFNPMSAMFMPTSPLGGTWQKVTVDSNGVLYAITDANELYYAKLNLSALPNISLVQANITGLTSGTPGRLFASNNVLYFAAQQGGLYSAPLNTSGPAQPLTKISGLPSGANVVDVYANTNASQQTSIYALVDSYDATDPNNGLYVAKNGSSSFTQLTPANATLDSSMVSVMTGTPSAIYIGSFGVNPTTMSTTAEDYTSTGNISKMDLPNN